MILPIQHSIKIDLSQLLKILFNTPTQSEKRHYLYRSIILFMSEFTIHLDRYNDIFGFR